MRKVKIAGTDLVCSKLIFGTANLFTAGFQKERQELLGSAIEIGITHFDTAPYYGFGTAERDLSFILKGERSATVTTKVGIYPPGGENQSWAGVFFRKAGGRIWPALSRPTVDFSIDRARAALHGSLRRLGRECIDLYLLHQPRFDLIATEEWQNWLGTCMKEGKIKAFGVDIPDHHLQDYLQRADLIGTVIQTKDSLEERQADAIIATGRHLQITYGYLSSAASGKGGKPPLTVLEEALVRNTSGAVIVSTRRKERVRQLLRIGSLHA